MSKYERLARLMKITTLINARRHLSRADLAESCEVSVRTIQRDINSLCYAGVPISWASNSGYGIMPGFFLPPTNLTLEEVFYLVTIARAFSEDKGDIQRRTIESAISKIIARIPDQIRRRLEVALDTGRLEGEEFGQLVDAINAHIPNSFRTLIGDIAHDLNNILTALLGDISLAGIYLETEEAADKVAAKLTEMDEASMQAKVLTERLLTFSSGGYDGHSAAKSRAEMGTISHNSLPALSETTSEGDRAIMGARSILVMDDEKYIRDITCEALSAVGYESTSAKDGTEAVQLYEEAKESGQPYDAVILDLVIPDGMGGEETIQKLMEIDPEVRAVAVSGYPNEPIITDFTKYGFKGAIAKPYRPRELSEVLHRVIW